MLEVPFLFYQAVMKKLVWCFLFFGILSFTLFQSIGGAQQALYKKYLSDLSSECEDFEELVVQFSQNKIDDSSVKSAFSKLRESYKKIEFFAAYYDNEFINQKINGAPLPKLMKHIPEITVIEPQGFQVIEELLYAEQQNMEKLLSLTGKLRNAIKELYNEHSHIQIYDRQLFEASRFQVIRVMAFGITGFDTPGSDKSIEESYYSLHGMWEFMKSYKPAIQEDTLKERFEHVFINAISYLKENNEFESFDRAYFLREVLNPLYGTIALVQQHLGIETIEEAGYREYSINYDGKDLFGKDFLNDNFFVPTKGVNNKEAIQNLGRFLFFDPVLSANNERSCASCHKPGKGFTDGEKTSEGFNHEGVLDRNTPSLLNVMYADRFFYDLRASKIEEQVQHVVFNKKEFNSTFINISNKISFSDEYLTLFREAFPTIPEDQLITKHTISLALAVYMSGLKSNDSEFDRYMRKEVSDISPEILDGFNLFMGKAGCGTCHFAPLFNGTVPPYFSESESEVLGVPATKDTINAILDDDLGRGGTGVIKERTAIYLHAFKTPSVRNAALTAPYMHNGVYDSLQEVMDFYNKGGGEGLGISLENQTLPTENLDLTKKEINNVILFIESLTDTTNLTSKPPQLPSVVDDKGNQIERVVGGVY